MAESDTSKEHKTDHQLIVHAQYIKDFSFENPNAPKVLTEDLGQPDVEINVSVNAALVGENQYEVLLNLGVKAVAGDTPMFLVDLTYAGLVSPEGITTEDINQLIMIEGPRLLFPFARALISNATRDGGFLPLNIQPVDFIAVYKHNLKNKWRQRQLKKTIKSWTKLDRLTFPIKSFMRIPLLNSRLMGTDRSNLAGYCFV
ncbi:MAG: protein-export chaperone SecB [Candidatus Puniceispirillaceae bacterium]